MVELLNICPVDINLCISRGDTTPWTFTVQTAAGVAVDITGFSYALTVDPSDEPTGSANNLFTLTGTLTTPLSGIVQFSMSTAQANQTPSVYFFDLEQTDGTGAVRTIAKGEFEFKQDISK